MLNSAVCSGPGPSIRRRRLVMNDQGPEGSVAGWVASRCYCQLNEPTQRGIKAVLLASKENGSATLAAPVPRS